MIFLKLILTTDAIEIYLDKLKDDGVLLFHVTNRHVDLEPILSLAADHFGVQSFAKVLPAQKYKDTDIDLHASHYIAFTRSENVVTDLKGYGWTPTQYRSGIRLWTDQYSNLISVFNNKIGKGRFKEIMIKNAEQAEK